MALFDPVRRAFGLPSQSDIETAREERRILGSSDAPEDRFAAAIADRMAPLPAGLASRTLHGLRDTEWPDDPDLRWQTAARTALVLASDTMGRSVSNMDPDLGRAASVHALNEVGAAVAAHGLPASIDDAVTRTVASTRQDVLAFMSYGKAAEHNASEFTRAMSARPEPAALAHLARDVAEFVPVAGAATETWLLRATRTRHAMAQSGLLGADRTVAAAVETSDLIEPAEGPLAPVDRRGAARIDAAGRRAMLERSLERTFVSAYGSDGPALARVREEMVPRQARSDPAPLTSEQQLSHAAMLMKEELRRSQAVASPRAILTGGQPGSGKSYIVNSVSVEFEGMGGAVVIDPDAIRPTLPYMAERIAAGELDIPNAANVDAGTIAYQMVQIAKLEKRNVIVDGTLQNTSRALDLAGELRRAEYRVEFHGMAVSPELSHARTYSRREEQIAASPTGFGRGVSDEFHDQAVKGYGLTVEMFQKKSAVNSMTFYANGGKMVETRFVNGQWVPAVDMKATLDHVHQHPSLETRRAASDAWTLASKAMHARSAPAEEIAKVDAFRTEAIAREEQTAKEKPDRRIAQIHAVQALGQGR